MSRVFLLLAALGLFGAGVWLGHNPTAESLPSTLSARTEVRAPSSPHPQHRDARPSPNSVRDWRRLLDEIEPTEVPTLLTSAQNIRDTAQRAFVLSRLLALWACDDAEAALAWAKQSPDRARMDLRALFRAWAERDPAAAAAHLPLGMEQFHSRQAVAAVAEDWSTGDLAAAIAWARGLQDIGARSSACDAIIQRLAQTDPAQAVALALSLDGPANAGNRLRRIVMVQAADDPAAALSTINSLPSSVPRGPLFKNVVYSLLQEDPALAGEFALTIPASQYQTDALGMVARRLAEESPQAALDWLSAKLPAGPVRSKLFRDTLISFASDVPAAAVPYLDQVAGSSRVNVALNLAANWVRLDPTAAAAWVSQLPADPNRATIMRAFARSWASEDPAAALAFALNRTGPEEQAATIREVGSSWPASSTADLRATLDQLPSGDAQEYFLDGVVSSLGGNQPQAAAELVASLPAGNLHDSAALTYISNAAFQDLPLASRVAHSIADNSLRAGALTTIARIWLTKDRAATTAWLTTVDLPEATKQDLLAPKP